MRLEVAAGVYQEQGNRRSHPCEVHLRLRFRGQAATARVYMNMPKFT
jgi:hypothetical protein